jgi:hypothetical protein
MGGFGRHILGRSRARKGASLFKHGTLAIAAGTGAGRQSEGNFLLSSSSGEIGFNVRSDYWLDVAVFEEKASQILVKPVETLACPDAQELEGTMKLYTGKLLEGYYEDRAL